MTLSDSKFMQTLFVEEPVPTQQKGTGSRNKLTVCGRFQQSLASLVQILGSSNRHYVRCIKPNDNLQPGIYNTLKVLLQLKREILLDKESLYQSKCIEASREKGKIEKRLPPSSLHQMSINEEEGEPIITRNVTHTDIIEDYDENIKSRVENTPKTNVWEYSTPDHTNWSPFDDYTQDLIEKAYCSAQKELILNHGYYAKDQYTIVFAHTLSFCNNKTGIVRGIRRQGNQTYRTLYRALQPLTNSNPLTRINSMYRKNRNNRKASILAQIDNISNPLFTVIYSPEIYYLSSDMVIFSESPTHKPSIPKRAVSDRSFILNTRIGTPTPRSEERKRSFSPVDRTPEMKSKSYFIPTNKLMYPFRQVSRLWGSQRVRLGGSTRGGSTIAKPKTNQTSLKQILENFANNPEEGSLSDSTPGKKK